jgi:hypothetical protein
MRMMLVRANELTEALESLDAEVEKRACRLVTVAGAKGLMGLNHLSVH